MSKENRQGKPADVQISALSRDSLENATTTIIRAFAADPLSAWLFPDPAERARCLRELNRVPLIQSRRDGHGTQCDQGRGVAIWLPPGRAMSIWGMISAGLLLVPFKIGVRAFSRFMRAVSIGERVHKQHASRPHWYLMIMAVDPELQGEGRGTALLQEGLARADEEGSSCYLETSNERNLSFYQRHGFVVVERMALGERGPVFWAMRREPVDRDTRR